MDFFWKKKVQTLPVSRKLNQQFQDLTDKNHFYLSTILKLFQYIKDFSFDLKEIDSEGFKTDIDRLSRQFETEEKVKKVKRLFDANQDEMSAFITREKKYLTNKEGEFKKIIQILSQGISTLNSENETFNHRIQLGSEKLEKITQLNDLRKMKLELAAEVSQMKATIERKKEQDTKQMKVLSSEVEYLKDELKKTKSASMADGLTGAYNRLAFDAHILGLISNKMASFSLMLLDIDDFKQINDTHGHQVGDRVIMALVQKCKQSIRSEDFLARYGGEEFVLILPGASLKQSLKRANLLCKEIAETQYALGDVKQGGTLSFKVSIGVSKRRAQDTVESVIERADQALYAAKRAGKNQALAES